MYLGYADALQEVESWTESIFYAAREQSRASIDNAFDIGAVDSSFAEEEGEDRDEVGSARGENLGAHTDDSTELEGGEIHGGHEING